MVAAVVGPMERLRRIRNKKKKTTFYHNISLYYYRLVRTTTTAYCYYFFIIMYKLQYTNSSLHVFYIFIYFFLRSSCSPHFGQDANRFRRNPKNFTCHSCYQVSYHACKRRRRNPSEQYPLQIIPDAWRIHRPLSIRISSDTDDRGSVVVPELVF